MFRLMRGFGSRAADPLQALPAVKSALQQAIQMSQCVEESASELLLETDPSNRQPRVHYVLHYQHKALQQLQQGLGAVAQAKAALGADQWQEHLRLDAQLGLTVADSLLARDLLEKSVRQAPHVCSVVHPLLRACTAGGATLLLPFPQLDNMLPTAGRQKRGSGPTRFSAMTDAAQYTNGMMARRFLG